MKPEVLVVGPMYPATLESLEREFVVHKLWLAKDRSSFLSSIAGGVRGIATMGWDGAKADLIDALPRLEIIACCAVGVDAVDLAAARRRKIIVTNTPAVLNDSVADLAMGLMIMVARRLHTGDRFVREGKWLKATQPLAGDVHHKRLGILGLGKIGRLIARRAHAFDMTIGYHSRRPVDGEPWRHYPKLVDLARESDFLIAICPGGKETYHMVDEEVMRALGPHGTLINVSRGSVVDEEALVRCLSEGSLGAAALDVFEKEPQVPQPLLAMENVVLAPHVGSATHETRAAMGRITVDNLLAHFSGKPPLTPVR